MQTSHITLFYCKLLRLCRLALAHTSCRFPSVVPGILPQRCLIVPHVQIQQAGFDCNAGNSLRCSNSSFSPDVDPWDTAYSEAAANLSFTNKSSRVAAVPAAVEFSVPNREKILLDTHSIFENESRILIDGYGKLVKAYLCTPVKDRPPYKFCQR